MTLAKSKTPSIYSNMNKPAYNLEELLAIRASVSESTISLDKFGDEAAIKEHVLRPTASLNFLSNKSINLLPQAETPTTSLNTSESQTLKKSSPTPSIKRGKAERLLKEHGSPPGLRVTAGGRIVPSSLPPLTSPFEYPPKGYRSAREQDNYFNPHPSNINGNRDLPQSTGIVSNDFGTYQNVPSSNSSLPVFNPMNTYGSFWPNYSYSVPWNSLYPGQYASSYGYLVPISQPQAVASSSQNPSNGSEDSNPSIKRSNVSINQQLNFLESQYKQLEKQKQEFDRDEIRQSQRGPLSETDKRKIVEQRKQYIIQLDAIHKSIGTLKDFRTQGFTHCDSNTLNPVASAEAIMNIDNSLHNGVPFRATADAVAFSQPAAITLNGQRRSHAVQIRAPSQLMSAKSSLNPTSPSYEPTTSVSHDEVKNVSPKTPTPTASGTEEKPLTTTIAIDRPARNKFSPSASGVSNSSPSTTDFFPNSAAEHSSSKYRGAIHNLQASDININIATSIRDANDKSLSNPELSTQPKEFFLGFLDRILEYTPRNEELGDFFYVAGYSEGTCYSPLALNIEKHALFEPSRGGISQTLSRQRHGSYFAMGFCCKVLGISKMIADGWQEHPAYIEGFKFGLLYHRLCKVTDQFDLSNNYQNTDSRSVSQPVVAIYSAAVAPAAAGMNSSYDGHASAPGTSIIAQEDTVPISPNATLPNHDAVSAEHMGSPNSQKWEISPKRSPSKQIRNLARHFRSSAVTDKSASNASVQMLADKRSNVLREGLRRLCN